VYAAVCTRFAHTGDDVDRPTGRPSVQHWILFSVVVYVVVIQLSEEETLSAKERERERKRERERENERRVGREGRRPNV